MLAITFDKVIEQHMTDKRRDCMHSTKIKSLFADYNLAKDGTWKGLAADLVELTLGETLGFKGKSCLLQHVVGLAADGAYFSNNTIWNVAEYFVGEEEGERGIEKMLHWLLPTWDGHSVWN